MEDNKETIDKAIQVAEAYPIESVDDGDKQMVSIANDIRIEGLKKIKDLIDNEDKIYNISLAVRLANDIIKDGKPKDVTTHKTGLLSMIKKTTTVSEKYEVHTQLPPPQLEKVPVQEAYPIEL